MEFYKIRYNILKLFRDTNIYYKNLSISIINLNIDEWIIMNKDMNDEIYSNMDVNWNI